MALNSMLKLKGQQQGDIKGSVIQKGREGRIMVIAFEHELAAPYDSATGQSIGKTANKPFVITKEIDRSSPLLYTALVTNETIVSWELLCYLAKASGMETNHYTVRLTNARLVSIRSVMLNNKVVESIKMPLMEEVAFVYEKIEWTWVDGSITSSEEWFGGSNIAKRKK